MKTINKFQRHLEGLETAEQFTKILKEDERWDDVLASAILQKFMVQFDLACKVLQEEMHQTGGMKDLLKEAGNQFDWFEEGLWIRMLKDRTSYRDTCEDDGLKACITRIKEEYIPAFETFADHFSQKRTEELYELEE